MDDSGEGAAPAGAAEKSHLGPWLGCAADTVCTVYGQFRDGAGNESLVVDQQILLQIEESYLPVVIAD